VKAAKCWCSSASGKTRRVRNTRGARLPASRPFFLPYTALVLPALVLTAGLGTRLDPITRLVAKAAVPLAGQTLIERSLGRLANQGVSDAVLNLHHRPETITSIVGEGSQLKMRVRYSWEPTILGSAGGPRRALPLLGVERFLVVNGDTLCEIDLAEMVRRHATAGADVTMAVVANTRPDYYNGILLNAEGRVTGFVSKGPAAAGSWHFVGVQVVEARVFAGLPDGVPAESVSGIYRDMLASGTGRLQGFRVDSPFIDVGTARDYLDAALDLAGPADNAIEAGAEVASSAGLARTVVWSDSSVGADAKLDGCIVAGARLPAGFKARDAVLVPGGVVRAGDNATLAGEVAVFPLDR
jgi:mannose-1-phosphate guanylyltransferase